MLVLGSKWSEVGHAGACTGTYIARSRWLEVGHAGACNEIDMVRTRLDSCLYWEIDDWK